MPFIAITDLPASLREAIASDELAIMVAGLNAKAARVAPCLVSEGVTPEQLDEARLIAFAAIARWSQAGSGAVSSQMAGPFHVTTDTRQRGGYNLWPSEISDLQAICAGQAVERQAFVVDTAPRVIGAHLPWCSSQFGALYCSCGTDIAGHPIYEGGADL